MTNKVVYNDNVLIDLTADTVDAENLMTGYTAHDKSGTLITGTLDPFKPQIIAIMQGYQEGSACCLSPSNQPLPVKFHEADTWVWDIPSYGQYTVTFSGPTGNPAQIVNVTAVQIYRVEMNVAITFERASWSFIAYAASRGKAADYWAVGDTKTYQDTSGNTRTVEIVDIGDSSMVLDLAKLYDSGAMTDYAIDWPNDTFLPSLPQDFKSVVTSATHFSSLEIFGASPLELFSTASGRSKGWTWWTNTTAQSGSGSIHYYYVTASGTQSSDRMTKSHYYNAKIVIS